MGTLFEQPNREHCFINEDNINDFFTEVKRVSEQFKMSKTDVIQGFKVLELCRRNELYLNNGDAFDEQMTGFGELFKELIGTLQINND